MNITDEVIREFRGGQLEIISPGKYYLSQINQQIYMRGNIIFLEFDWTAVCQINHGETRLVKIRDFEEYRINLLFCQIYVREDRLYLRRELPVPEAMSFYKANDPSFVTSEQVGLLIRGADLADV